MAGLARYHGHKFQALAGKSYRSLHKSDSGMTDSYRICPSPGHPTHKVTGQATSQEDAKRTDANGRH